MGRIRTSLEDVQQSSLDHRIRGLTWGLTLGQCLWSVQGSHSQEGYIGRWTMTGKWSEVNRWSFYGRIVFHLWHVHLQPFECLLKIDLANGLLLGFGKCEVSIQYGSIERQCIHIFWACSIHLRTSVNIVYELDAKCGLPCHLLQVLHIALRLPKAPILTGQSKYV